MLTMYKSKHFMNIKYLYRSSLMACLFLNIAPMAWASTTTLDGSYRSVSGSRFEAVRLPSGKLKFSGLAQKGSQSAYIFGVAKRITDSQFVFKRGTARISLKFESTAKLAVECYGDLQKNLKFDSGVSIAGIYKKSAAKPTWNADSEDTPWQSE